MLPITKIARNLFKLKNVVSVYYGYRYTNGKRVGEGIVVGVSKKVPANELSSSDIIPKSIEGELTDVVESGEIKALALARTDMHRPIRMGVSIGHKDITAGTAGFVVRDGIVSNNHVLANVNMGKVGDDIYQPGPYDGNKKEEHKCGTLLRYEPIQFSSCAASSFIKKLLNFVSKILGSSVSFNYSASNKSNYIDCAICKPSVQVSNNIIDVGTPSGTSSVNLGDTVAKSGRTTELQEGEVTGLQASVQVNMGNGMYALFEDQIVIGTPGFSAGGDSGSAIVKRTDEGVFIVGLLFAGSSTQTIANNISRVLVFTGVL